MSREAMQMALTVLERTYKMDSNDPQFQAVKALCTALSQPEKEWVGLTDDEYELMAEKRVTNYFFNTLDYAHAIEAKLKEKNT